MSQHSDVVSAEEETRGGRSHAQEQGNEGKAGESEKQDRDGFGRDTAEGLCQAGPSRRRHLHSSPARKLHEARDCESRRPLRNEHNESEQDVDDASGAHRQDAFSKRKQASVEDLSSERRDVDKVVDDRNWKKWEIYDAASGHRQQRNRDDASKQYKQRIRGADDVSGIHIQRNQVVHDISGDRRQRRRNASDNHSRRERDVDSSLSDVSRKRGYADDIGRRWDDYGVLDNHKERRWDGDDTQDKRSRHIALGHKSYKNQQDVDEALGDGQRSFDAKNVLGYNQRRHNIDGALDSHSQRRHGDVDHTHNAARAREQQRRSPDKRNFHQERKDAKDDSGRDRFSMRFRSAERNEDELPELFSVHRAKVQSVRPFGVFVRLEGFYKQGLVHLSQLSDHEVTNREDSDEMKVQAIAAVAGEGDQVWVKVISLKGDGGGVKIGCSLKLVSQSSGKDLDPNNLKLDQQKPKGNCHEPKKVTLDAIYNVVCPRCGGHGHLKMECYGTAAKSYELLSEEDNDLKEQLLQPLQTPLGMASTKPGFGRGRAMVLPSWMTHGSGVNAPQNLSSSKLEEKKKKRRSPELPDKITTVEEAMALISQVKKKEKKDKHHRKEHKKHKKDRKSKKLSNKERSSRKDRG